MASCFKLLGNNPAEKLLTKKLLSRPCCLPEATTSLWSIRGLLLSLKLVGFFLQGNVGCLLGVRSSYYCQDGLCCGRAVDLLDTTHALKTWKLKGSVQFLSGFAHFRVSRSFVMFHKLLWGVAFSGEMSPVQSPRCMRILVTQRRLMTPLMTPVTAQVAVEWKQFQ